MCRWLAMALLAFAGHALRATDTVPHFSYGRNALVLDRWLLVGPFFPIGSDDPLDDDALARFGYGEDNVSVTMLVDVVDRPKRPAATLEPPVARLSERAAVIDLQKFYGRKYVSEGDIPKAATYAAAVIDCVEPSDCYLMIGSDDGSKVWLNGTLILNQPGRRALKQYNACVPVQLRPGANELVVKIEDYGVYWGVTARIEPNCEGAAATALKTIAGIEGDFLNQQIFGKGDFLKYRLNSGPAEYAAAVSVENPRGEVLYTFRAEQMHQGVCCSDILPRGVYKARSDAAGTHSEEWFVVGDWESLFEELCSAAEQSSFRDPLLTIPLRRRFQILKDLPLEAHATSDWERKLAFLASEAASLGAGKESWRQPGLHLLGFTSELDGSIQFYRTGLAKRSNEPVGLIVIVPTVISVDRPFLESPFVAAHREAERLTNYAGDANSMVLWPGYRGAFFGHPIDFSHLDQAIREVQRRYRIDPHRITLVGACGGGWFSTMAALRWPSRFAGIGLLNPVFHRGAVDPYAPAAGLELAQQWADENDPFSGMVRQHEPAMYIVHDGAEPGHGEIEDSLEFIDSSRKFGSSGVTLRQRPQTIGQHFESWREIIEWAGRQRIPTPDDKRSPRFFCNDRTLGPISRALAEPFVVVTADESTVRRQPALRRLGEQFALDWKQSTAGECRLRAADTFEDPDGAVSNLVLLGNAECNPVWARLAPRLPIAYAKDRITIAGNSYTGENLAFAVLFRNSSHPDRRLLLIGASDLTHANFGKLTFSTDGYYDFIIWNRHGDATDILALGRL